MDDRRSAVAKALADGGAKAARSAGNNRHLAL